MRPRILTAALLILARLGHGAELAVPRNVTIQVEASGVSRILWDPIYDDELLGYSVWKRFEGGGTDFTRLMLPVKVGKEVRKMPVTSQARYAFKDPKGKPADFVVLAEYASGKSRPSETVKTRLARRLAPDAPAGAREAAELSGTAKPAEEEAPREEDTEEEAGPALELPVPRRSLLTPPGKLRSWFAVNYSAEVTTHRGDFTSFSLVFFEVIPLTERTSHRVRVKVPFGLSYGLFPGLELGLESCWADEKAFLSNIVYRGVEHHNIHFDETAWMADSRVGARFQPAEASSFTLGASMTLPTGKPRLNAFVDDLFGLAHDAGTGLGASRLNVEAALGDKWNKAGPFYFARYSPSATHAYTVKFSDGSSSTFRGVYGDLIELGGGVSHPYAVLGQSGTVAFGVAGSSISRGRVYVGAQDLEPFLSDPEKARLQFLGGLPLTREDQLELALEFEQSLGRGISSRGKAFYTLKPTGYIYGVGGGFHY